MKRKYTRKNSKSSPIKEESNLPPDILQDIERTCEHRKVLGLSDDREERIQRALRYQEFINGRL
jgi:hypothetical protein